MVLSNLGSDPVTASEEDTVVVGELASSSPPQLTRAVLSTASAPQTATRAVVVLQLVRWLVSGLIPSWIPSLVLRLTLVRPEDRNGVSEDADTGV